MASSSSSANAARRLLNRKVLVQMAGGIGVMSLPVAGWWYWSRKERAIVQDEFSNKIRIPNVEDTYDYIITEKCQAGDVILFDRRCELCARSPWAALACLISKSAFRLKDNDDRMVRSVDVGQYNHCGLLVPGFVESKHDKYDPTNLLVLEATPSGIVGRKLKDRLEQSQSNQILLLQLTCPGEQRSKTTSYEDEDETSSGSSSQQKFVERTRNHVEKELTSFRDRWIQAGQNQQYDRLHSTVTIGGAMAYYLGLQNYLEYGPVSPSAFLVLTGLQQAAVAPSIADRETRNVKVEDFLRDHRFTEQDAVRLRPGWKFLAPIPLKQRGG